MSKKTGPKISFHKQGYYYTTLTIDGKKKFIYGDTEAEVSRQYIELKYLHNQGYNATENPTVKEYAYRWYNIYKKGRGAIKTREMYMNVIEVHIVPAMGKKRIKEINSSDVQALLNKTNSSKSLQHKVRITLNQIFKKAQADRLIAFNPVTGTDPVDAPPPVRRFYTPEQREILCKILDGDKIFPLVYTILNSGMRATEAIALMRRRDLDLENCQIRVRESTEFEKAQPKQKDTKTPRGVREIPIPSDFAAWLTSYLERAPKSLYVFPGKDGGQMSQTTLKNRQRRADAKLQAWFDENPEYEKHRFSLHFKTLRHTYCTELYDLEIDEVSAAEIMGHTVAVMREIYTHIQQRRKERTAVKIENLYKSVVELPEKKRLSNVDNGYS